jgi:hypothetical protein
VYEPTGTVGAATTSLTPGLTKSAKDAIPFGLPGAKITQSLFVVNDVALLLSSKFEFLSTVVHLVSADMKTSHGEPATICCSNVLDDPELTMMLQLYWSLNAELMFVITLAKLEAANIVKLVDE